MAESRIADDLAAIDIVRVATALGVQVGRERNGEAKALCPFHRETTPSFTLYQSKSRNRSHYYCFGCQAHGGAADLVRGLAKRTTYRDAGLWLEEQGFLQKGAFSSSIARNAPLQPTLERLLELVAGDESLSLLQSFAQSRGFDLTVLRNAGVVAGDLAPVIASISPDSELGLTLVEAGLARAAAGIFFGKEPEDRSLRATISGPRILIPMRDRNGAMVSLIARATTEGEVPKYKLPRGFTRSEHLFGLNVIFDQLSRSTEPLDIFVVEGVFDALRLRSLGKRAVALLGIQISDNQIKLLSLLSVSAADLGRVLRIHLFLDHDTAGATATARILPRLLAHSSNAAVPFLIDAVRPPSSMVSDADPDNLLRGATKQATSENLRIWARPALDVVVSTIADLPLETVRLDWQQLPWTQRFQATRRIARILEPFDDTGWRRIQDRLRPDIVATDDTVAPNAPPELFAQDLDALLSGNESSKRSSLPIRLRTPAPDYPARLIAAVELARESASSREYPVDVASWHRLLDAAVVFAPILRERLARRDGPIRPFTAHFLPRANGTPRLKCGPCPDDAALQQYVLGELLRTHETQSFPNSVPAVRWWLNTRETHTTGRGPGSSETVSFAYQVDMEALESRPDRSRRRDMFRPFIDCWNSYIAYASRRISRMQGSTVHVARLDVSRFYDEIPRAAIETPLRRAVRKGMATSGVVPASLLAPEIVDPADRAEMMVRWLLDHSMGMENSGYTYFHPATGNIEQNGSARKGLPQGPTLSAYLANIALFDLDQALADEVSEKDAAVEEPGQFGGLYARYVDDIILAAPSEADLKALVNRVEAKINALGLRLNEKSEVLLPKTKAEAREWLVERRGAGFFEYGDASEAPTPVLDGSTSWGDTPDLDRRAALHVILDTNLDDPLLTRQDILRRVLSRAAQSADTPHGDLGHIARRIWLRAAIDETSASQIDQNTIPACIEGVKQRFFDIWTDVVPSEKFQPAELLADNDGRALAESLQSLAVLDGVERLLMGAPHRNPTLTEEGRIQIGHARDFFIRAVAGGMLTAVLKQTLAGRTGLPVQLSQARMILEARAALLIKADGDAAPLRDNEEMTDQAMALALLPCRIGQLASFVREGAASLLTIIETSLRPPLASDAASRLLHAGLAYLQALGGLDGASGGGLDLRIGPLEITAKAILSDVSLDAFAAPEEAHRVLSALRIWLTDEADPRDIGASEAIVAFVSLLQGTAALSEMVSRRPIVSQFLGGHGMEVIPQPPLPGLPGLFFCNGLRVSAVIFSAVPGCSNPADRLPKDFRWSSEASKDATLYVRFATDLPEHATFLKARAKGGNVPSRTIAKLYQHFYDHLRRGFDLEAMPLTAAPALLLQDDVEQIESAEDVAVLAWCLPAEDIRDLAFPVRGSGLGLERLSEVDGDWLWRLGRAFNDLFGIHIGFDIVADSLEPIPPKSRIEVALRRKVLAQLTAPRLRNVNSTKDLLAGQLPHTLRRGLKAMAAANGAAAAPSIWLHFLEGRLMSERMRHAPALAEAPGGAAHILAAFGRRTVLPWDDAEGLEPDFRQTDARLGQAVNAWQAIATAIDNLTNRGDELDAPQLALTAAGTRLHALTLGFRDVALALIARLKVSERPLLALAQPDLGGWGFGADAVLIRPRFGPQDTGRTDVVLNIQLDELFGSLGKILSNERRSVVEQELWRITLLGWLVTIGVLTSAVDTRFANGADEREARPTLEAVRDQPRLAQDLSGLARQLLTLGRDVTNGERGWPWGLFDSASAMVTQVGTNVLCDLLEQTALKFGPSRRSAVLVTRDEQTSLRIRGEDLAEQKLQAFQYLLCGLVGDQRREPETEVDDNGNVFQVWGGVFSSASMRWQAPNECSNSCVVNLVVLGWY
jgi:hypothetical protein